MKPTVEGLTEQFTRLIGPEAFAKAEAAITAAKAAAEAAAKAAAEKAAAAAAAAAAAKAAAPAAPAGSATPAGRAGTPLPASGAAVAGASARPTPAATGTIPGSATPATPAAQPATAGSVAAAPVKPATAAPAPAAVPPVRPAAPAAAAPRPAVAPGAAAPRPAASAPAAAPAPAPIPTLPVQVTAHAAKGYNFDAAVAPNQVVQAAQLLDQAGFGLDTITGVDWMAQNEMEVVYDYFHPTEALRVVVRTRVPRATPELPSITDVFPGANWHERETHDFFGIRFTGHPNLKPFLLPEDADFHPLRKDYKP